MSSIAEYMAENLSRQEIVKQIKKCDTAITVIGDGTRPLPESTWGELIDWNNLTSIDWPAYKNNCVEALRLLKPKPAPTYIPGKGTVDINAIKARVDIVDVISGYITVRKTGRRFAAVCPFHNDKSPSLIIYPESQSWHCFGCNLGGDVIEFIKRIENVDFTGAVAILGNK